MRRTSVFFLAGVCFASAAVPSSAQTPATPTDSPTTSAAPRARPFRIGEKVLAQEKSGSWSPATIKRVGKAHFYVSYDGWPDSWDEWVPDDRVKARPPGTPPKEPWKAPRNHKPKPIPPEPVLSPVAEGSDAAAETTTSAPAADASAALAVDPTQALVEFVPDPAAELRQAPAANITLRGGKRSTFDNVSAILAAGPIAAAIHTDSQPGENPYAPQIERLDLAAARPLGITQMPGNTRVLNLSADGEKALAVPDAWGVHSVTDLAVFDITKPQAALLTRFRPFSGGKGDVWDGIDRATFITPSLILAESHGRSLAVIRIGADSSQVVWTLDDLAAAGGAAISPGGKYVAVALRKHLAVIEAATGQVAVVLPDATGGQLAFSPDGNRLAAVNSGRIQVYALTPTELLTDVYLEAAGKPDFITNDFLLLGDRTLLDLTSGLPVWSYSRPPGPATASRTHGDRLWYTVSDPQAKSIRLRSLALPDAAAKQAAEQLRKTRDAFAVGPGMAVSLDVQLAEDPAAENQVAELLRASLQRSGLKVSDDAPLKLVARFEPGESKRVPYRLIGKGEQTADIRERKWRVALEKDGQILWRHEGIDGAPMMISLRENQSLDEAVRAARPKTESLFGSVSIPSRIAKPEFAAAKGETTLPTK